MLNRNDITKAFEDLGGLKELVRLAKKDVRVRLKFFAHVLPKLAGAGDAEYVEPDPEVLRATLLGHLERVIDARKYRDIDGDAVVYSGGPDVPLNFGIRHRHSHIDDGSGDVRDAAHSNEETLIERPQLEELKSGAADSKPEPDGTPRGISNTSHRKRRIKQPSSYVASVLAQPPKPKPLPPPPLEVKVAAPPQQPQQNQQPSATQLFLQWEGRQRMNWSPPRSWSGW